MCKELPWWLSGKESTCQCRGCGFDPWVGEDTWRRKWQPILILLCGKSHEQRSLLDYSLWTQKRVRHDLATKATIAGFITNRILKKLGSVIVFMTRSQKACEFSFWVKTGARHNLPVPHRRGILEADLANNVNPLDNCNLGSILSEYHEIH